MIIKLKSAPLIGALFNRKNKVRIKLIVPFHSAASIRISSKTLTL